MGIDIVIPVYIINGKNVDLILDQLYVAIESYYFHKNTGTFFVYTNDDHIEKSLSHYKTVYHRDVVIVRIDFEKLWGQLNLPISDVRTRREFVISKLIIPFIHDNEYVMLDWDILTTGLLKYEYVKSDKVRFFSSNIYDGLNLRQVSLLKGLVPQNEMIGRNRWINAGVSYSPKGLAAELIREYWDLYNSIDKREYKGIYLYDIIGEELIYNLMLLDGLPEMEEVHQHNINLMLINSYNDYNNVTSMYCFGEGFPKIINVHFVGGYVKPFDVEIDDKGNLSFKITVNNYMVDKGNLGWVFNLDNHRTGSYNLNALMFSTIWQHTRYSIKEKLFPNDSVKLSTRYSDFFKKIFIDGYQ